MSERKASPLWVLLVFGFVALFMVWLGVAVGTDDALWFVPTFTADAVAFDLYWDGDVAHLEPGSEGYALLNTAFKQEVRRIKSSPDTVGLSDATLDLLRQSGRLLEVYYAQPVRVHSRYNFGPSPVYLVPLSGDHASAHRVFNASRAGPLELYRNDAILAAAEAVASSSGLGGP